MPVAEDGAARRRDRGQAVEVIVRVPAAEMHHLESIQRDVLALDLVEITCHHPLGIGHDGHAVGAQHPEFARSALPVARQEPVGVAVQLERAEGLLEEFKAAGQRVGIGEQLLQRMIGDADALFPRQSIDV